MKNFPEKKKRVCKGSKSCVMDKVSEMVSDVVQGVNENDSVENKDQW